MKNINVSLTSLSNAPAPTFPAQPSQLVSAKTTAVSLSVQFDSEAEAIDFTKGLLEFVSDTGHE